MLFYFKISHPVKLILYTILVISVNHSISQYSAREAYFTRERERER
jgi:hypothetical protein